MNHSIYLESLLCSAIFLNKKEAGTFLCYISIKKRQFNVIFSKKHSILSIQIKKIYDELTRHAAVRMDADDEITRHKTFKVNIPCNGTWNWSQLSGKLKQESNKNSLAFWVQLRNLTLSTQDGRHIVHGNLRDCMTS